MGGGNRTRKRERVMMTTLWFFKITRGEKHAWWDHALPKLSGGILFNVAWIYEDMDIWINIYEYMTICKSNFLSYIYILHVFPSLLPELLDPTFAPSPGNWGFFEEMHRSELLWHDSLAITPRHPSLQSILVAPEVSRSCGGIHNFFQYTHGRV